MNTKNKIFKAIAGMSLILVCGSAVTAPKLSWSEYLSLKENKILASFEGYCTNAVIKYFYEKNYTNFNLSGNAFKWFDSAKGFGYKVLDPTILQTDPKDSKKKIAVYSVPKVDSIIVYPIKKPSMPFGHVGVVSSLSPFLMSNANTWKGKDSNGKEYSCGTVDKDGNGKCSGTFGKVLLTTIDTKIIPITGYIDFKSGMMDLKCKSSVTTTCIVKFGNTDFTKTCKFSTNKSAKTITANCKDIDEWYSTKTVNFPK